MFSIEDLIGYASETIASMLRGIAAQHDFEYFHANSAEIIKSVVFGNQDQREFENGFVIFAVDIKQITPLDPNIAEKLNIAISNNMDVYVKKIQQKAELDAKKQVIESEKIIETQRKELLEIQLANLEREEIAKGRAQVIIANEEKIIQVEKEKIEALIKILQEDSENYLKLMELEAFKTRERAIIVPEDSRLWIPIEHKKSPQIFEED